LSKFTDKFQEIAGKFYFAFSALRHIALEIKKYGQVVMSEASVRPLRPRQKSIAGDFSQDASLLQERIERLMPRLRMAVIFGGNKATPDSVLFQAHNTRSWKSYEAVANDIADSLRRLGFRHVDVMPDDMSLGERLRKQRIDMAWINSGGVQGYNSAAHTPAMLEMFGIPYIGHDPLAATALDNKHAFKREAVCAGLPTAAFSTWNMERGPFRPSVNSRFQRAFGDYQGPFIVKPVSGRASLHVAVADDVDSLPDAIAECHRVTENIVLIERFLPGREYCIAVGGPITAKERVLRRRTEPFSFAALERVLEKEEKIFTSMDVKAITNERFRALDKKTDAHELAQLHRIAREVFLEFNLCSLIRLDVRADEKGDLYILEANPKPDLKKPSQGVTSLVVGGLPELGMDYDDLILSLFADRFEFLLKYRSDSVQHLRELCDSSQGWPKAAAIGQISPAELRDMLTTRITQADASEQGLAALAPEDAAAGAESVMRQNLPVLQAVAEIAKEEIEREQSGSGGADIVDLKRTARA
jgi:D-alanine-D-alanine ligase